MVALFDEASWWVLGLEEESVEVSVSMWFGNDDSGARHLIVRVLLMSCPGTPIDTCTTTGTVPRSAHGCDYIAMRTGHRA